MEQTERNRLEAFRQLRKEVRHSEEYLVVGIDIAKERHHAFFGTARGKSLLRRLVFSNDHEGFRKLLDQTEALRVQHGLKKVVYGMEPTANYHKPLGEYLIKLGKTVVLVSGVERVTKVAVFKETAQEAGAWLPGSDSESFDCSVLSGDGPGL